jgi:hypothetical protein
MPLSQGMFDGLEERSHLDIRSTTSDSILLGHRRIGARSILPNAKSSTIWVIQRHHSRGPAMAVDERLLRLQQTTLHAFSFLVQTYGCRVVDNHVGKSGLRMVFQNDHTGIVITFGPREPWYVSLCRLVEGRRPVRRSGEFGPGSRLDCFGLLDLASLRRPEWSPQQSPYILPSDGLVEEYATTLSSVGSDVLRGDFSVFLQLNQIVHDRAEQIRRGKEDGQQLEL